MLRSGLGSYLLVKMQSNERKRYGILHNLAASCVPLPVCTLNLIQENILKE